MRTAGPQLRVARAFPRLPSLAAALIGLTACARPDATPPEFTTTDSAGVTIVRNGATGALPQHVLDSPRVSLRIGTVEGEPELQFFRLWSMAVDAEDNIYAADAGHAEVRVFVAAGRFVRRIGRRGQGPGEFAFPSMIHVTGDTVVVMDGQLRRMTAFTRAGDVLTTWSLNVPGSPVRVSPVAPVPGGWLAWSMRTEGWSYVPGVTRRDTIRVVRIPDMQAALDALARAGRTADPPAHVWTDFFSWERGRIVGTRTPIFESAIPPLWEPEPVYAIDARGFFHFSPAANYLIESYDPSGKLVRRLTREYTPVPITEAMVARYRDKVRAHWDTASMLGEAPAGKYNDEIRATFEHVPTLPPIGRLLVSSAGALWVERIDLVPDPVVLVWTRGPSAQRVSKWDVFDPAGRLLGTVTLPPGFSPRAVGEDWVLGILRDELDVQYVARLEIGG